MSATRDVVIPALATLRVRSAFLHLFPSEEGPGTPAPASQVGGWKSQARPRLFIGNHFLACSPRGWLARCGLAKRGEAWPTHDLVRNELRKARRRGWALQRFLDGMGASSLRRFVSGIAAMTIQPESHSRRDNHADPMIRASVLRPRLG